MRLRTTTVGVAFVGLLIGAAFVRADSREDAAKLLTDGKVLLAKADFDGALAAFEAAMKADPKNDEYRQECSLLSRIMKIRGKLDEQKDAEKWAATARIMGWRERARGPLTHSPNSFISPMTSSRVRGGTYVPTDTA